MQKGATKCLLENLRLEAKLLMECSTSDNDKFREYKISVFSRMKANEYTNLAKTGDGLLMYGYCLFERLGNKGYHRISNVIRNVARLLLTFRTLTGNAIASSFNLVDVKNYDDVVEASKVICGHEGTSVDKPSLLLMLGRCLKAITITRKTMAIKQKDVEGKKEVKMFLELHEQEWGLYKIHAHSTMKLKHWKTPDLLRLKSDLLKLKNHLVLSIQHLLAETES